MTSRLSKVTLAVMGLLLYFAPETANAQEVICLTIQGKGTATVMIPNNTKENVVSDTAYILDGGEATTGITTARLNDKPILQALLNDYSIKHLVFVCSHPDRDHMGGLMAIVKNKNENDTDLEQFDRITFVDTEVDGEVLPTDAKKSLFKTFQEFHPAYDKVEHKSARKGDKIVNAFTGELAGTEQLKVANLSYTITGGRPHDQALIVEHSLIGEGGVKSIAVNFDDAENGLVGEWIRQRVETLGKARTPLICIVPHHGSNNTDLSPLLDPKLKLNWQSTVFTVNPRNKFKHPGARNMETAIRLVGLKNVHITGRLAPGIDGVRENVRITTAGVAESTPQEIRRMHDLFIAPRLIEARAAQDLLQDQIFEERAAGGDAEAKVFRELEKHMESFEALEWIDYHIREHLRKNPPLFLPPGDKPWDPGSPSEPSKRPKALGPQNGGKPVVRQAGEPNPGSGSGDVKSLEAISRELLPEAKSRAESGEAEKRIRPIKGGVILCGAVTSEMRPLEARYRTNDERVEIEVDIADKAGVGTLVYDDVTMTELWSAYYFIRPTKKMQESFGVGESSTGLVGYTGRRFFFELNEEWKFGIHPAIARTVIGRDAMHLDMLLSCRSLDYPKVPRYDTYQWYDQNAAVTQHEGRLMIRPKSDPSSPLMRFRLWGVKEELSGVSELQKLLLDDFDEVASNLKINNMAECRLRRAELALEIELQKESNEARHPKSNGSLQLAFENDRNERLDALWKNANLDSETPRKLARLKQKAVALVAKRLNADDVTRRVSGESPDDADEAEVWKQYRDLVAAEKLDTESAFKRQVLRRNIILKSRNAPDGKNPTDQEMNAEYFKLIEEEGLLQDPWALIELCENKARFTAFVRLVREHGEAEKTGKRTLSNLEYDESDYLKTAYASFPPYRRIERFARIVALLQWLQNNTVLPDLTADVKPITMKISARLGRERVAPTQPE
ncbi:MAG: hypothetical protein JWP89_6898 [Schlesneria sp.]|nr:hypothetical protein [Schlesneria sp.]